MRRYSSLVVLFGMVVVVGVLASLNPSRANATGSATLTLAPSSGTYDTGSNFTVTIHENSGSTPINETTANLTYDQTRLQYVSNDISGSAFDVPAPHSGGGGVVTIALGSSGMLTGDQVVASVTFKVLATSGSLVVNFSGDPNNQNGSTITAPAQTNYWDGNTAGGTYTVTPTSSGGGGTGGSGGGTGSTSSGSTSSGSASKTTPKTTTPKSSGSSSSGTSVTNNPAVASGGVIGYPVAIKVVDSKGLLVMGAQVILDGTETTATDDTGIAGFTNVPAGPHKVSVTTSASKTAFTLSFTVAAQAPTALQQFQVKLSSGKKLTSYLWIPIFIIILLVMFGGGISLLRRLTTKLRSSIPQVSPGKPGPSAIAASSVAPAMPAASAPVATTSPPGAQVFYPKTPRNPNTTNNPEVDKP